METITSKNHNMFSRAKKVFPGGVNSPIRSWKELQRSPMIVKKGMGALITSESGRNYIDYCMSFGALILGHAHPKPLSAAINSALNGSTFGIHTHAETMLGELITENIPFCEKVRFVSSGTEALSTIVRLARGYTKRKLLVKFDGNYHGHIDPLLTKAGSFADQTKPDPSSGILEDTTHHTISLPYNDLKSAKNILSDPEISQDIALVVLEPIAGNMGVIPAEKTFLHYLREQTKKIQALLCFDEVISGFRVGFQGASGLYGIEPDLVAYGKIVGGGFPAACVGGKSVIMDALAPLGNVFQAGTLSGNPVAMSAGYAVLSELLHKNIYQELQEKADFLFKDLEEDLQNTPHSLNRVGSMFSFFFEKKSPTNKKEVEESNQDTFRKFFFHLLQKGVYFSPSFLESNFLSQLHTEKQLKKTQETIRSFFHQ